MREACGGSPVELAHLLLGIARDRTARNADRIAAMRELLDRGWGKAPAFANIEGADPLELDEVAKEIQELAAQLRARQAA